MNDLRSLEVFYWVVHLGGFGRAAERLHMTQPAVSGRIGQLEAAFGVRLLDRSTRTLAATPKGVELYGYAERMLALRSEMMDRLTDPADLSGTVRLGTAETLVHTLLGPLLRELYQQHPRLTPEVTVDISPNLEEALLGGELDVVLLLGPSTDPRVRSLPLQDYELSWVACPGLPVAEGCLSLAELARWPILSYARGTLPHAQLARLFARPGLPPTRIFSNSSLASIVRMAVDGIGIGTLPLAVIGRELAEGQLRLLRVEPVLAPLRFTASILVSSDAGPAQAVAELASRVARDHPAP